MRVAIDARALLQERTGIGTYTFAIARGLAARPDTSVGLFAPRPFPASVNGSGPEAFSLQTDHHPFGIVWLHSTLPQRIARWGADVLISALTIGPARGETPFVSTVHDLTPLTHPEWHAARTLIGFVPLWERTVERASRFLCVSQTTARELVSRYPETASRVRVARNGVDTSFFSPADDPVARRRTRQRYSAGRPFVLYLGTLEPRKNVEALVVACERMWGRRRSRPDLVLAGGAGWKTGSLHRRIARSAYRDKIHVTGYAARDAARELYRVGRGVRVPVAGRRLRAADPRGDGVRHAGRGLDGRGAPRGRRRRRALRASPRRRGALASHRASARGFASPPGAGVGRAPARGRVPLGRRRRRDGPGPARSRLAEAAGDAR